MAKAREFASNLRGSAAINGGQSDSRRCRKARLNVAPWVDNHGITIALSAGIMMASLIGRHDPALPRHQPTEKSGRLPGFHMCGPEFTNSCCNKCGFPNDHIMVSLVTRTTHQFVVAIRELRYILLE